MTISENASPPWCLVTIEVAGKMRAAVAADDRIFLPSLLADYAGIAPALLAWDQLKDALRDYRPQPADLVEALPLLTLAYPNKVLCSGPNYVDHLEEMGQTSLGEHWRGYFFMKPPTTSLIGDGATIYVDNPEEDRVDWEGELAVVIGTGGRRIPAEDAMSHVAGYLAANDISLRGPHRRDTPATPFTWDWVASKAADTSCPIGPGMVPAWLIDNVQDLRIITTVNGEVRQDGNTSNMVLSIAQLISDASDMVTLEPGDLILTGTPAGVGAGSGTFLSPGDVVTVSIPGVGSIQNRIERRVS